MSHVDTAVISHISLCYGYGGIDLGLHRIFGDSLRLAAVCEIEAFAVENALSKMEAGIIPAAPIWNDLRTFPWEDFQGIGLVSGGFPCQPFSAAGKRAGDQDPRHLFPFILDGIRRARPRLVFLENVEGIISAKLAGDGWNDPSGTPVLLHVLRELERVGYTAAAGIFDAASEGAPHQRKRVFVMAHRNGERGQLQDWWRAATEQVPIGDGEAWRDGELADSAVGRCDGQHARSGSDVGEWSAPQDIRPEAAHAGSCGTAQTWPSRPGEPQHGWEPPRVIVGDTSSEGHARAARKSGARAQRQSLGHTAEPDACVGGTEGGQSNGRCGQWEAGRHADRTSDDAGHIRQTQPALGGDADGPASGMDYAKLCVSVDNRTDELRLLGNGVVPATAERAFRTLWEELVK